MNDSDRTTAVDNHDPSNGGSSDEPEFVVPEVLPVDEGNPKHKIKGAAQVAAGAALTAAGVPMLVLPGPGAAAIAGGAALISKGQRNYSGRAATPFEEKLDDAAEKLPLRLRLLLRKRPTRQLKKYQKLRRRLFAKHHLLPGRQLGRRSPSSKALPVRRFRWRSPLRKALPERR